MFGGCQETNCTDCLLNLTLANPDNKDSVCWDSSTLNPNSTIGILFSLINNDTVIKNDTIKTNDTIPKPNNENELSITYVIYENTKKAQTV